MTRMSTEVTVGTVPIHHQIADQLRTQIATGELSPGASLPSVSTIAARWGCSAGVARSAIAVLQGEGLVSGGRGRAATVRQPPVRVRVTVDDSEELKRLVLAPRHKRAATGPLELTTGIKIGDVANECHYATIKATEDLAREFSSTTNDELLQRTYEARDRETGTRISWSRSFIPMSIVSENPDLLDVENEPWPGGHQHQLFTVGIEIDRLVRTVTAIEPSVGERQRWGMEEGVPVLVTRSRSIDILGQVVEVSDAHFPADRTELSFTEQLKRWPKNHPAYNKTSDGDR